MVIESGGCSVWRAREGMNVCKLWVRGLERGSRYFSMQMIQSHVSPKYLARHLSRLSPGSILTPHPRGHIIRLMLQPPRLPLQARLIRAFAIPRAIASLC